MNEHPLIDKILFFTWILALPLLLLEQALFVFIGFFQDWEISTLRVNIICLFIIIYFAGCLFQGILVAILDIRDIIKRKRAKK